MKPKAWLVKNGSLQKVAIFIWCMIFLCSCRSLSPIQVPEVKLLGEKVKTPSGMNLIFERWIQNKTSWSEIQIQLQSDCSKYKMDLSCRLLGDKKPENSPHLLSVLQGMTDVNSTVLNVVTTKESGHSYLVTDSSGLPLQIIQPTVHERPYSQWVVHELVVSDLQFDKSYLLWIYDVDGKVMDMRRFAAFSSDAKKIKWIAGSCSDDSYSSEQILIWEKIRSRSPQWLLLIGDNVYVDKYIKSIDLKAEDIWRRYVETRRQLGLYFWPNLVPTVAIWDDHDYAQNDGDRYFPLKNESLKTFKVFFPRKPSPYWEDGFGAGGKLKLGLMQFLLLDNRSFRSPNNLSETESTHFGGPQEDWMFEKIKEDGSVYWIVSGDQFFGGYHKFESFEGSHFLSFEKFLARLKLEKAPFLFMSGDRHFPELMRLDREDVGQDTYEITTSGLHSSTYKEAILKNPNRRRIAGTSGPLNFLEVETRIGDGVSTIKIRSLGLKETPLFEKSLELKGQKNESAKKSHRRTRK